MLFLMKLLRAVLIWLLFQVTLNKSQSTEYHMDVPSFQGL